MVWKTDDLTPLAYLIPSTAAEVGTGTAFYYNKAKLENKIKLMSIYKVDLNPGSFESDSGSMSYGGYPNMYDVQG